MTHLLTPAEFAGWRIKLAKLNARAERRGFTGRLELTGRRVVVVNTGGRFPELPAGAQLVMVEASATGEPPCYAGWRLVAALDALPAAAGGAIGWVVRYAPGCGDGSTVVDRAQLRAGWCDHCATARPQRRRLYAVQNVQTGEMRQVGSSCLRDFLGSWSTTPIMVTLDNVDELLERSGGWTDAFTPGTVLAAAVAAVEAVGWTSRATARDFGRPATADLVRDFLSGTGPAGSQARELLEPGFGPALRTAAERIATLVRNLTTDPGEYEANLLAALQADAVEDRQLALVCSAVPVYQRLTAPTPAPEPEPATPVRGWGGTIGEKLTVSGTVKTAMPVRGYNYQSPDQMLLVIEAGHILAKAYSSARWVYELEIGDSVSLIGTVKAHDVYAGDRQTVLTRIKRC